MDLVEEDNNLFSAKELINFILNPPQKTLLEAEQLGFIRLFRGYSQADSLDDMVRTSHLSFFIHPHSIYNRPIFSILVSTRRISAL